MHNLAPIKTEGQPFFDAPYDQQVLLLAALERFGTFRSDRKLMILERILQRVWINPETGCWEWLGPTSGNGRGGGYARMCLDGQTVAVHRVTFTLAHGYIPGRKQLDHECRVRLCVNPFPPHLEMVTHKQNQKRRDQANGQ